jgi:hypothetical protein
VCLEKPVARWRYIAQRSLLKYSLVLKYQTLGTKISNELIGGSQEHEADDCANSLPANTPIKIKVTYSDVR